MISLKPQDPHVPASLAINRRRFIYSTTIAAGAVLSGCSTTTAPAPTKAKYKSPNEKIYVGIIGAGGKGDSDTSGVVGAGGEIAALCDVDSNTLNKAGAKYTKAQKFKDFRKMLETVAKDIDAVTVSTPDHCHAAAAVMAMRLGKHVYCQKPLTHSVYEARVMRRVAKEMGVATQMGNQGSAGPGLRRAVEIIQAGLIGKPKELHVWSNRPIWPQGIPRPEGSDPVPDYLDWDLWLGPAPERPYKKDVYHTFKWRGWRDFGTGALGDMACHTVNMPFRALKLGYPNVVECEAASELFPETYPKTSRLRFEFPAREGLPPLKFWWYDGDPRVAGQKDPVFRPNPDLTKEIVAMQGNLPTSGALVIGDKGKVFSPDDYGSRFFIMTDGETKFTSGSTHEACKAVPQTIPRNEGAGGDDERQKKEWFRAMQGGAPAYSNFDIAAYLTEIILLGCVAMNVGVGKRLDWDGPGMRAKNNKDAAKFVKFNFRPGWTV